MMVSATHTQVETAIARLPEILRPHAVRWFQRLSETLDKGGVSYDLTDDLISQLTRVVACSEFAGKIALREWDWLVKQSDKLQDPPDILALRDNAQDLASADRSLA